MGRETKDMAWSVRKCYPSKKTRRCDVRIHALYVRAREIKAGQRGIATDKRQWHSVVRARAIVNRQGQTKRFFLFPGVPYVLDKDAVDHKDAKTL